MSLTRWIMIAALFLALAVILGAFGAHALKARLSPYSMSVFDKAVLYHFFHALGLLMVCLLAAENLISERSAYFVSMTLSFGIIFFSGSLYLLAITGIRWFGMLTPVGGVLFIISWIWLAYGAYRRAY